MVQAEGLGASLTGIANLVSAIRKPKKQEIEIEQRGMGRSGVVVDARGGNPLHYQTHCKPTKSSRGSKAGKGSRLHYGK